MADNYISRKDDKGSINISEEVIGTIVRNAIQEIDGVAGYSGSAGAEIADFIGMKGFNRGVRIKMNEEAIVVDLTMHVKYGFNIIDVANKVQDNVASTLLSMTGIEDVEVNVHVAGIEF